MKWSAIDQGHINFLPADIAIVHSPGKFGKGVRYFTRYRGETPSIASHTFLIQNAEPWNEYSIVDTWIRAQRRNLNHYRGKGYGIAICRDNTLTPDERVQIAAHASNYIGRFYSPAKICGQLSDGLLGKIFGKDFTFFTKLCSADFMIVCSFLVAKSYATKGRLFGVDAGVADPDDILDFILAHLKKYSIIFYNDKMDDLLTNRHLLISSLYEARKLSYVS